MGNNSPTFIVPVASTENKNNIANFFSGAKKSAKGETEKKEIKDEEAEVKHTGGEVKQEKDEQRATKDEASTEDNAPKPVPSDDSKSGVKRGHNDSGLDDTEVKTKVAKTDSGNEMHPSTIPPPEKTSGKAGRSATSNGTKGSPVKAGDGSQRITDFFNK